MFKGQTVFSQVMDFLPIKKFRRCVDRYNGNYRVRSFTCYDPIPCMAFAQLTYRESLRDIECCLRTMRDKLYHMGIRGKDSHSTIAYANENRDWRIYCDFAQNLIHQARQLYANDDFGLQLQETVCALDATIIDLCLSVFPRARFRKARGGIKLHTLLDLTLLCFLTNACLVPANSRFRSTLLAGMTNCNKRRRGVMKKWNSMLRHWRGSNIHDRPLLP